MMASMRTKCEFAALAPMAAFGVGQYRFLLPVTQTYEL